MFRYATFLLPLVPLCHVAEAQQGAPVLPGTHQEFITSLLTLLADTEQCLAGCVDAASTEAALPRLRELEQQAHQLSATQHTLPEPTVQDYMAAHPYVAEFNKLWEAIGDHIKRLEQASLISSELRSVLKLAPAKGDNTHNRK